MKLGLALSGGGIRGIAHSGVLKALEDNNIKVDIIGGTSSGGIIAALYAMGYSPYYIYVMFKRYAKDFAAINSGAMISGLRNYMLNKKMDLPGLKTGEMLEKMFEQVATKKGIKTIEDIEMPLVITAVDIADVCKYVFTNNKPQNGTEGTKYITDITIGKAVRATSSFPAIFCPVHYKTHMFLDGGALDNVPVQEVKKQGADKVIAVNFAADSVDKNSNAMDIAMKTIDVMGNKISEENIALSDYLLTVSTDKTGLLDIQKLDSCYKYGYETVIKNLDRIKKIIS